MLPQFCANGHEWHNFNRTKREPITFFIALRVLRWSQPKEMKKTVVMKLLQENVKKCAIGN